jgi:uncharacterized protein YqfB (UPF0267 family)
MVLYESSNFYGGSILRINGHNYKSLSFTILKEKLLSKEKTQSIRALYIPTYEIGEKIALVFKSENKKKEFLYFVKIEYIEPIRLCDISEKIAKRDGFNTIEECQQCIMKLNHCKINQWVFIIQWKVFKEYDFRSI